MPHGASRSDGLYRIVFEAVGWLWLLRSLWDGIKASMHKLLARLYLSEDALPMRCRLNRRVKFEHYRAPNKQPNRIERRFAHLKINRTIATR